MLLGAEGGLGGLAPLAKVPGLAAGQVQDTQTPRGGRWPATAAPRGGAPALVKAEGRGAVDEGRLDAVVKAAEVVPRRGQKNKQIFFQKRTRGKT